MSLDLDKLHTKAVLSRDADWIALVRLCKSQQEEIIDRVIKGRIKYGEVVVDRNLLTNIYRHLLDSVPFAPLASGGQITWKWMQEKLLQRISEVTNR